MNSSHMRKALGFGLFLFVFSTALPLIVDAQYSGRISTSYRSKINKLDDDKVEDLPIPVLFGISLRNITPNFGDPRGGGTREHEGLDIMAPEGAPIVSPTEAVVIRTGSGSSAGKYVTTVNPGDETFIYMHLSEVLVRSGDVLEEGDLIGLVGDTGNAEGGLPHLHWEVRDGRRATDPYPRVNREFTLEEKIEYLEDAIKNTDDEDDFVQFVADTYTGELWRAKNSGILLPEEFDKALGGIPTSSNVTPNPPGDLDLNSQGPLVVTLQEFLIAKNLGPSARALASAGATGFFGPITQRALIEYQLEEGISPAAGYFGPITRAHMLTP
jgi:murein DD-endopeptidase MepM/ murein hydrolase activator NlpD